MNPKEPQNDGKYFWTNHAKFKLRQYGLSGQRIKRVLRAPRRKEVGIVKDTVAVMQPVSTRREKGKEVWKQEIWAMYQNHPAGSKKNATKNAKHNLPETKYKIISVWKYPGVSPKSSPIPEEILEEIEFERT